VAEVVKTAGAAVGGGTGRGSPGTVAGGRREAVREPDGVDADDEAPPRQRRRPMSA